MSEYSSCILCLDFGTLPANGLTLLEEEFSDEIAVIYTTHRHGFKKPVAARVFLALSRPVSTGEYESITRYLATHVYNKPEALLLDGARAEGSTCVFRSYDGKPVDVEQLLRNARKWEAYELTKQAKVSA